MPGLVLTACGSLELKLSAQDDHLGLGALRCQGYHRSESHQNEIEGVSMITVKHGSLQFGDVENETLGYGSNRSIWYNTGQVLPSLKTGTPP
jgi:hypothetical protein